MKVLIFTLMFLTVIDGRAESSSIGGTLKPTLAQSPKMERRGAQLFKQAREACLKEKAPLKGKKLRECIVDYQRKEAN